MDSRVREDESRTFLAFTERSLPTAGISAHAGFRNVLAERVSGISLPP